MSRGRTLLILGAATLVAATAGAQEQLPAKLDVSGPRGHDGANGADGHGTRGQGGEAGPSTPGWHAGTLDLTFAPARDAQGRVVPGRFVLTGTRTKPRELRRPPTPAEPVEQALEMGEQGTLQLLARGGDGGHGGRGGKGGHGHAGSDGSDATCHRSGGRGGDGGDGGDGGNGTSGSDAGDGGDVTIRVSGQDTHLLLLLEPHDRKGQGGRVGLNGSGGPGGSGGRGGSSHSSHGSGNNRCSGRSGGSSGRSGRRGADGHATIHAGKDGKDGVVRWVVDGVAFDDRYRLRLAGFGLESANQDGVLEPGEEVIVHGITVTNGGAVPTPPPELHPTRIYLPLTRNVSAPSEPLLLPVSVGRGQSHTLAETLRFTIPDIDVETAVRPDVRWSDEGLVDPRAHLADARRDHPEFPGSQRFPLAFPLVLRPVRFAAAVGAGETRKVALEVENVSTKPFGAAVDEWLRARGLPEQPALRRAIRVTLAFRGTTLSADEVQLLDPAGRPVPLGTGPFEWDLAALGPGERARAEVSLGLRPEATPYAGAELAIDLHLGRLGCAPVERRVIERRRVPLRVASPWRAPDRPSLLLVTNMGVERDVVRAWRGLAAGLGLGLAVWDVSYHGHLPLGARTDRTDALLMEACANQPMVVLCNTFASPIEDEQGAHAPAVARSFLAPDEVARAAARHGLGLLLVGGASPDESGLRAEGPAASRAALLVPVQPPAKVREHASPAALLAALDAEGETDADPDALERVAVKDGWLWGQPELGELHGFARGLADDLEARWPDRRYVIVSRFRPATDDRWYWNAFDYGHLEVRRTVDRSAGVHALPLGEADLARGEAVLGPAALEAALGPLPFARKLELLRRFLEGELPAKAPAGLAQLSPEALGDALAAAILHDLHVERTVWRQRSWSGLRASGWYRERLRHHRALAAIELSRPVAEGTAAAGCAARIVQDVKWRGGWWEAWDVVVPLHAARYYVACATAGTSAGRGLIDDFADRVFGAGAPVPAAAPPAARSGPEPERGDASLAYTACLSEDELQASCALEADRAARRAAFQEALDRLRIATELGEGLGGR